LKCLFASRACSQQYFLVHLVKNNLKGSLPSEMRHLSRLDYLDMEQNRLMGSIPEELGYLTNLKYLGLAVNKLEGQIPSTLGGIDNLGKCPMIGNDS
jgi:Leucine-rich repeat (LRR) protein